MTARLARVDGAPVGLREREFQLLARLAGDPERVFTRHELLRDVWGYYAPATTRTLDSHACRLRRKLGGASRVAGVERRWVVNVWGVGYRLR